MEKVIQSGSITVDLHGKNRYQAKISIDAVLRRAGAEVYRIRLIHGCHGGSALREMIAEEYAAHPKVRELKTESDGVTVLILRRL